MDMEMEIDTDTDILTPPSIVMPKKNKDKIKVPMHPCIYATSIKDLRRHFKIWIRASETERREIRKNVVLEMEFFGDLDICDIIPIK